MIIQLSAKPITLNCYSNTLHFKHFKQENIGKTIKICRITPPNYSQNIQMKIAVLFSLSLVLTGCMFILSSDIKLAEQQLALFKCKNIAHDQLMHNPIIEFHVRTLNLSKNKAAAYIQEYKDHPSIFHAPLSKVLQEQFVAYKSACEFLGGVTETNLIIKDDIE